MSTLKIPGRITPAGRLVLGKKLRLSPGPVSVTIKEEVAAPSKKSVRNASKHGTESRDEYRVRRFREISDEVAELPTKLERELFLKAVSTMHKKKAPKQNIRKVNWIDDLVYGYKLKYRNGEDARG